MFPCCGVDPKGRQNYRSSVLVFGLDVVSTRRQFVRVIRMARATNAQVAEIHRLFDGLASAVAERHEAIISIDTGNHFSTAPCRDYPQAAIPISECIGVSRSGRRSGCVHRGIGFRGTVFPHTRGRWRSGPGETASVCGLAPTPCTLTQAVIAL